MSTTKLEVSEELDMHLESLEGLIPQVQKANDPDRTAGVSWTIAREFGFVRRYVDAAEIFRETCDDPEADDVYLPEAAEQRLGELAGAMKELGLGDHLPEPVELAGRLRDLAHGVLRSRVEGTLTDGEFGPEGEPEVFPTKIAERADKPRAILKEADEVLSVARTEKELGLSLPPSLFGEALAVARRLNGALEGEVARFVKDRATKEYARRLLGVDEIGKFLWDPIYDPSAHSRLLRRVGEKAEG